MQKNGDTLGRLMQHRYYDPGSGRGLSVDPVTAYERNDWRFLNRCVYAFNIPYKFTDPDERCASCDRFVDSNLETLPSEMTWLSNDYYAVGLAIATEVVTTKGLGLIAKGGAAFRAFRMSCQALREDIDGDMSSVVSHGCETPE